MSNIIKETTIWVLSKHCFQFDFGSAQDELVAVCVSDDVAKRLMGAGMCTTSSKYAQKWAIHNGAEGGITSARPFNWLDLTFKEVMSKIKGERIRVNRNSENKYPPEYVPSLLECSQAHKVSTKTAQKEEKKWRQFKTGAAKEASFAAEVIAGGVGDYVSFTQAGNIASWVKAQKYNLNQKCQALWDMTYSVEVIYAYLTEHGLLGLAFMQTATVVDCNGDTYSILEAHLRGASDIVQWACPSMKATLRRLYKLLAAPEPQKAE